VLSGDPCELVFRGRWLASMPSETAMTTISTAPASCALQVFIGRVRLYNEGTRPKLQNWSLRYRVAKAKSGLGFPVSAYCFSRSMTRPQV